MGKTSRDKVRELAAITHRAKRKNIPTEELRDFVREEEQRPAAVLYPRDPSLDPQLVWKGKDEQDAKPLEVPAVPIYIQEKIHPQAIIEEFRATQPRSDEATKGEEQLALFADFNGLPAEFDKRVDFYHHEQNWSNRMILGDSLLVMNSLAEKEGLKGQVQMIYIDPPYGIRFGSNWQVSTRKRDVKDGKAEDATRQPEQVRAFRDTWKLGIHSYLAYIRDRLVVARELLTESGSVFVQIGDENVHLVRCVLDEVFGSDNFCALISFRKTAAVSSPTAKVNVLAGVSDLLIWYAKNRNAVKYRQVYLPKAVETDLAGVYGWIELQDGQRRRMSAEERAGVIPLPEGSRVFRVDNATSTGYSDALSAPIKLDEKAYVAGGNKHWKTTPDGMRRLAWANRLVPAGITVGYVRFIDDFPVYPVVNYWPDTGTGSFTEDKVYVVQTGTKTVERCLLMTTDPGDLVLDPTCGSGTTAYVAEQWGRRWITCDTSRVAMALARTRLMCARYPYYLLADSAEGRKKEAEVAGTSSPTLLPAPSPALPRSTGGGSGGRGADADIRRGFVYQRVPHVTLKSIANNPDIREGMTREQIDAAIAKHAETETLYDKPYEDKGRLRVAGPFTVESLSPHRTISVEDKKAAAEKPAAEGFTIKLMAGGGFANHILEYLRKTPIQTGKKEERLKFDSVEVWAGQWVNGEGRYVERHEGTEARRHEGKEGRASDEATEARSDGGREKRAAICIGPEHGTVGPELIKEAAKEAVRGVGFDLLIVCGFAFDPHVSEEIKRYGNLTVLPVRMNPDLAMGDELLKKTGAGNLFMVFGEPDIEITRQRATKPRSDEGVQPQATKGKKKEDGGGEQVVVKIKGLDVYDPTTGEIRSSSTDDIACWFIDTNYNGESFFVRHAYFTGADEPYEKLKRALRAEVDEGAWATLYSTKSRPFDVPESGKIAVKVINHYGDEVLKVYDVK